MRINLLVRIHAQLKQISRFAVWIAGGALMLAAFMITIDVIFRKFLGLTMRGSDEISGYVFAAATTWAYSYCLLHRANVRIDAFYNLMPAWPKAICDVLGVIFLLIFMSFLTERAVVTLFESIVNKTLSVTTLRVPLWIPQMCWFGGLLLFTFTLTFVLVFSVTALIKGDLPTVNRVAGVFSVEEEIEEETHSMDLEGMDEQ